MVKAIAYSICAVLLITSTTFGQAVGPQTQIWNIGLGSNVGMQTGTGDAHNDQVLGTLNIQGNSNGEGTQGWQGMGTLLGQTADVTTVGAPVSVEQNVNIAGDALIVGTTASVPLGQTQTIGDYTGPASQYEGVSIGADQTLLKTAGGTGTATGTNGVGFAMAQVGGNAGGNTLGQGTLVVGAQQSTINGLTPASAGTVTSDMTAIIIQDQVSNAMTQ